MTKIARWTERAPDHFVTPGPRAGMTIDLRRSKGPPTAWEGRFSFAVGSGVVVKRFHARDAEAAKSLAWAAATEWAG